MPAKEACATAWQINYWAAQVCSTMSRDGSKVSGRLAINCFKNKSDYLPCEAIRIREVEMFADGLKVAKWVGGTYSQHDFTTGDATYPCTAGKTYYIKGWEVTVQGPDGVWSDTKATGPEFTYQC